jgi:hypothetical protein
MRMIAVPQAMIRALLWGTVAVAFGLATLLAFEQLMLAGPFGFEPLVSTWFHVVGVTAALVIGNWGAYCVDRLFRRQIARSRANGRSGRARD